MRATRTRKPGPDIGAERDPSAAGRQSPAHGPGTAPVLCGSDFSPAARGAADVAAALAHKLEDSLTLVHATPIRQHAAAAPRLRRAALRLGEAGAGIVQTRLECGAPAYVLTTIAAMHGAGHIVVASHDRRGPSRWLLGSVSERTAATATVPTWIIRRPRPLLDWLAGQRTLRVFLAFDRSAASTAALTWAARLTQLGPCAFVIAHLDWPPEELASHGLSGPIPLVGNPPRLQALLDREIASQIATHLDPQLCRIRIEASWGRADVRLGQMARQEKADLVVTGCGKAGALAKLWRSSVSRGVLRNTQTNVVVVPARRPRQ